MLPLRLEIKKKLPSLRFEIFYVLSLVQNEVDPLFPSKALVVLDDQLVRSYTNVECIFSCPTCTHAIIKIRNKISGFERRTYSFETSFLLVAVIG
jgi:hypothetical protein